MFITRAFAATAVAGTVIALTGPLAASDTLRIMSTMAPGPAGATHVQHGPHHIAVVPTTVRRGDLPKVTVDGTACRANGNVTSGAFPRTSLTTPRHRGASIARPRIFADAEPGRYTVTATCGGRSTTGGPFTVASKRPMPMPTSGARTGMGGSIRGMNSTEVTVGGALIAAAVAAGGIILTRRRTNQKP